MPRLLKVGQILAEPLEQAEVAMKDQIKKAFEKAITLHQARGDAVKTERERIQSDREKFEADWSAAVNTVVVPALEEIINSVLTPNGWVGAVRMEATNVVFEAYKDDMKGVGGRYTRPTLTFQPDKSKNEIWANASTRSQSGSLGGAFNLAQLDPDLVQEHALEFFERLCNEPGHG